MSRRRSSEPLWWLLFAAGGTVAAFALPVLIVLTGLAAPLGGTAVSYARMAALVAHPLGRLFLFAVIALSLFHWAHRFRYGLIEGLQLRAGARLLTWACYGTAVVLSAVTAAVLLGV